MKRDVLLHRIECILMDNPNRWFSARGLQEAIIERYSTDVPYPNTIAAAIKPLIQGGRIQVNAGRRGNTYRWGSR